MNELFVGIDPSFSGTAIVVLNREGKIVSQKEISTSKTQSQYDIEERIYRIGSEVLDVMMSLEKVFVTYIEEISFGSSGADASQLGALNYHIRVNLLHYHYPFYTVPPTTLKKFISGNGQAKKNLMLKEVYKRWGVDFNSDNLADAYSLARMALDNYNNGVFEIIKKKKEKKQKKIKMIK
jgi:crossover junction endodeoxyribonuclease RuvC